MSSSFNTLIFEEEEEHDTADIGDFDAFNSTVNNLSGKIESFSLSDVVETSLNILRPTIDNGRVDIKRSTSDAYSYGEVDPKQSLLHTPGNSDKIYSLTSTSECSIQTRGEGDHFYTTSGLVQVTDLLS